LNVHAVVEPVGFLCELAGELLTRKLAAIS
jgi:hypothetical protein